MSSNNDSIKKTLIVAFSLCIVCSVIVSGTAVLLKPTQQQNKLVDRQRNILAAAGLLEPGKPVEELFQQIEARVVNLETGEFANDIDPSLYDQRKAAKDPKQSVALSGGEDIAGISRLEKYATIYLYRQAGELQKIILPVHGYGLWSTLYGYLALEQDANTVIGMGFYEHAETPGLGGEVDNPKWKELWVGKKVYNPEGEVAIEVIKGKLDATTSNPEYKIDGLSGATLTSRGITNLMVFWLGDQGFRKFLNNLTGREV